MTIINFKEKKKKLFDEILKVSCKNQIPHIGSCLSCLEIMMNLFYKGMRKQDFFLLSKGHAAIGLYAILKDLDRLKEIDINKLWEHPHKNLSLGIMYSSGSLGQGLPVGAGLAMGRPDARVFVLMGDGECEEGSVWEAANFIIRNKVANVIPIIDANRMSQFQYIERETLAPKWEGFGWRVEERDQDQVWNIDFNSMPEVPTVWIINTIKGRGLPYMEDKLISHYKRLNRTEYEKAIRE